MKDNYQLQPKDRFCKHEHDYHMKFGNDGASSLETTMQVVAQVWALLSGDPHVQYKLNTLLCQVYYSCTVEKNITAGCRPGDRHWYMGLRHGRYEHDDYTEFTSDVPHR